MIDPVLIHAASAALACVLLLGAVEKLRDPQRYAAAVAAYGILPALAGRPFAYAFVLAETLAGALLLAPSTRAGAAWLALAVLAVATAALAVNLLRGRRDIDCGCGGPASHGMGLSWWLVARNAVLACWALPALTHGAARALQGADAAAVAGLTLSAVGLYYTANHLIASHFKLQHL
ncbi:MauE/DoxX family redox-associated membrane protein [Achromobacter sp. Marseille-Q4962]|uniref:MauE/DoxX family redox-associated membrane protein n=1 Tax=Achromobacter sp. Marseille-Q4962 TaxID=2942202 RepID=UPI002074537C|nr:MauE/DoxX family redox-associated membrane protein [Achromobacter sp. Marseille-Q4962]